MDKSERLERLLVAEKNIQIDMESQMNVIRDELLKASREVLKYKQQCDEVLCKAQALERELNAISKKDKPIETHMEMMDGGLSTSASVEKNITCSTKGSTIGRKKTHKIKKHNKGKAGGEALVDHTGDQDTKRLNAMPKIWKKFYEHVKLALPVVLVSASTLLYFDMQSYLKEVKLKSEKKPLS